jgi:predicted ester cyclase
MSDEKIVGIVRNFISSMEKKDLETTLSFLTEDAIWVAPDGTFKGRENIRRYLKWEFDIVQDEKVTESGNGIIVQGNKSFFEHVISSTVEGKKNEFLAMCAYEFSDDKIKNVRTVYDRLSIAKQLAKGWLAKWVVNSVISPFEKGLR